MIATAEVTIRWTRHRLAATASLRFSSVADRRASSSAAFLIRFFLSISSTIACSIMKGPSRYPERAKRLYNLTMVPRSGPSRTYGAGVAATLPPLSARAKS